MEEKRICNSCGIEKNITDFVKSKKHYYRHRCKDCSNKQGREKRAKLKPKELIPCGMKKCGKCKIIKNFCEFHASTKRKSGYSPNCKKCKKEYVINNNEKEKQRKKDWYIKNKELTINRSKSWVENNREDRKKYLRKYYKEKPYMYIYGSLIRRLLIRKSKKTAELLGYTTIDLKTHLEKQFTDGMSWDNHGEWHVDHIRPICSFEPNTSPSIVNDLNNLRPMWATTREINGIIYEGNLNKQGRY